jgi:hypothetical protein
MNESRFQFERLLDLTVRSITSPAVTVHATGFAPTPNSPAKE